MLVLDRSAPHAHGECAHNSLERVPIQQVGSLQHRSHQLSAGAAPNMKTKPGAKVRMCGPRAPFASAHQSSTKAADTSCARAHGCASVRAGPSSRGFCAGATGSVQLRGLGGGGGLRHRAGVAPRGGRLRVRPCLPHLTTRVFRAVRSPAVHALCRQSMRCAPQSMRPSYARPHPGSSSCFWKATRTRYLLTILQRRC